MKDKKIPFKELASLHIRAFKILRKKCPGQFESIFCNEVLSAVIPYVGIYLSAQILNELAGERNPETVWRWVWITVLVTAVLALLKAVVQRWQKCREASFWSNLNKLYTDKMLQMDFCVLDEQKTHDMYSQIRQNDNWGGWGFSNLRNIFRQLVSSTVSIISAIILTAGLFVQKVPEQSPFAFLNSPLIILGLAAILLVITLTAPRLANKVDDYYLACSDEIRWENRVFTFFSYIMPKRDRALDTRIYNQQDICHDYLQLDPSFDKIARYIAGPGGLYSALSGIISTSFTGFAYLYVCLKAWAGAFGVGSVTQYVGSITALSKGVTDLFCAMGTMKQNAVFLKACFDFLDLPDPMYQGSLTTEKRSDRKYEVEFRNVSFRYPGAQTDSLHNLSLKFKIGSRLAVVGKNGSGKTTFIKLLCRLYDPTEGEILLNGINIRKYRYDDYLKIFSVVFQDFQLLSLPLGQNVAAAKNYDPQRAKECLEMAGFGDRLARMPGGLETCLYKDFSKEGVEVSGGEAQKIAIARALYKDAPFIILDEPTAALDPIAEAEIYSKFNEIITDKTAVYISHRLSSCKFCDEIAVFDGGTIVQFGNHQQLVADTDGLYYQLWTAQAKYYTKNTAE